MSNARGAALMVAAMAGFAIEDAIIKQAATQVSPAVILLGLGAAGLVLFGALAALAGQAPLSWRALQGPVLARGLAEMVGTLGFVMALALTTLSSTSAIMQAAPLLVTMGAALFLGEPVGWRRWTAICVGFAGVLLILRPGLEGFRPASLFAVLGVIGLAARDVATRRIPADLSALQLAGWGFGALIPAGLVLLALGQDPALPDRPTALALLAAFGFGSLSYYALTLALRMGEMSVVAPFRYARLVFALILGRVVFGEVADGLTLLGAAIIIGSGLYTLARERLRARRTSQTAAKPL